MGNNQIYNSLMRTSIGNDLFHELMSLSWNNPIVKQIDINGVSVSTHAGLKRTRNEDRFGVCIINTKSSSKYFLSVICDGVGSSQDGDVAATIAIASLAEEIINSDPSKNLKLLTNDIIVKTDQKVALALKGSGLTTLSLVIGKFGTNEILAANIGDSRVYKWDSSTSFLEQITVDDTFENELKGTGLENSEVLDARGLRGTLSQAVGEINRNQNSLKVNIYDLTNNSSKGAILVTDGAWKSDELGFELISKNATSSLDAARRIAAFSTWSGGIDNVSIIAIEDFNFITTISDKDIKHPNIPSRVTIWSHDAKFTHTYRFESTSEAQVRQDIKNKNKSSKPTRKASSKSKLKSVIDTPQLELVTTSSSIISSELQISSNNDTNK